MSNGNGSRWLTWTGATMVMAAVALAALSLTVAPGEPAPASRWALAAWGVLAGAAYVGGLWLAHRVAGPPPAAAARGGSDRRLYWVVGVGLVMRLIILFTPPFLEDDFYRYLWEGAVVAHGGNPYRSAPADPAWDAAPPWSSGHALDRFQLDARTVRSRINHPDLTTVYGPVAQAAFALAHVVSPWNLLAWRGVLMVFDGLTVLAVLALLRWAGAPATQAAWYWWNPLLLREVYSSGHLDVLALPLVVLALLLGLRQRAILAGLALAVAAAVKIWPVVLLPLIVRAVAWGSCPWSERTLPGPRPARPCHWPKASGLRLPASLIAFVAASILLWLPVLAAPLSETNGFRAYALRWNYNDAVFRAAAWLADQGVSRFLPEAPDGPDVARVVVTGALLICISLQAWRLTGAPADLAGRCVVVVAVMFFISPAQFPWYYLWMLPLLAVAPRSSLLAYTALLPLYYVHQEHASIVWIEHLPILCWFALENRRLRRRNRIAAV